MIGHLARLRENDDSPLCIKKKPPFFDVRALVTRENMRSEDAQYNISDTYCPGQKA